ncbi:HEAT repeat domain-containing protein [Corallococcus sp. AB011P]|uniref:HEAT repeat domain-containing protein n=1 Tax=Corallococcus sp. AB011P TaxID=2316735 RepID=UPI000EA27336|nr:HEAT repeat domain-containing protein [Corallococcus sp. AB011P]RKG58090.1 HEAT repeat domain-containing protein [Corallococcus sp. AB011P]
MESHREAANRVVKTLELGRGFEKFKAIHAVEAAPPEMREELRRDLQLHLRSEFKPEPHESQERSEARGWLLAGLGRVVDQDDESADEVRRHLDPSFECNEWVRYWALEGVWVYSVNGGKPELAESMAKQVRSNSLPEQGNRQHPPLAYSLATVMMEELSQRKVQQAPMAGPTEDSPYLEEISQRLDVRSGDASVQRVEAMVGALRVIPVNEDVVIKKLCHLVRNDNKAPAATYDAICALGQVNPEGFCAKEAIGTLQDAVERYRPWAKLDARRREAIHSLGKLGALSAVETLLPDLTDKDPAIVQEAAVALRNILGVQTTVSRILEEMLKAKARNALLEPLAHQYANALRAMGEPEENIEQQVVQRLESAMAADVETQEVSRLLLMELGGSEAYQTLRALVGAMQDYQNVLSKSEQAVSAQFEKSLKEARIGFWATLGMDLIVFLFGVVLLGGTALLAMLGGLDKVGAWAGVASGGVGLLGILYGLFVTKPRELVNQSVDHMLRLKLIFLGYMHQLSQIVQLFTRRVLQDETMSSQDLQRFSELVREARADAIQSIRDPAAWGEQPADERSARHPDHSHALPDGHPQRGKG